MARNWNGLNARSAQSGIVRPLTTIVCFKMMQELLDSSPA
jgi:hypothetical protein